MHQRPTSSDDGYARDGVKGKFQQGAPRCSWRGHHVRYSPPREGARLGQLVEEMLFFLWLFLRGCQVGSLGGFAFSFFHVVGGPRFEVALV
jgi:hypothetical protein